MVLDLVNIGPIRFDSGSAHNAARQTEEMESVMEYKQLDCMEHGGTFTVERKRGRPPRSCSPENVCDQVNRRNGKYRAVTKQNTATAAQKRAAQDKAAKAVGSLKQAMEVIQPAKKPKPTLRGINRSALQTSSWCKCDEQGGERHERGIEGCKYATRGAAVVVRNNPSVPIARELKEQLEPLGWTCHAKAYFDEATGMVDFIATRDTETITVQISDGKALDQHYSIWNDDRPALNSKPKTRLSFDPEELSDVDLIRHLAGHRVTWWNNLGKIRETGSLPSDDKKKITIQHSITVNDGEPDELPGSRIVTFVDQDGTGFRSFKVGSLMAVK